MQGYLRGHGTYVEEGKDGEPPRLVACVAGVVERVNKLISVRPIKSRRAAFLPHFSVGVWFMQCYPGFSSIYSYSSRKEVPSLFSAIMDYKTRGWRPLMLNHLMKVHQMCGCKSA